MSCHILKICQKFKIKLTNKQVFIYIYIYIYMTHITTQTYTIVQYTNKQRDENHLDKI